MRLEKRMLSFFFALDRCWLLFLVRMLRTGDAWVFSVCSSKQILGFTKAVFVHACFNPGAYRTPDCFRDTHMQGPEGHGSLHRLWKEQGSLGEILEHQGSRAGMYTEQGG